MSSERLPLRGLNHLTFVVADLDRSLSFWRDRLGGRLRARGPRMAYLDLGGLWICLELGRPAPRDDHSHVALDCAPEDFDRVAEALADLPRWKENRSEGASLYLTDPDGHRIEIHVGTLETRLAHYRAAPDAGITVFD